MSNAKFNAVQISLDITKQVINKINVNKLKKLIYLSTAQVYGKNLINKVSEKTIPNPINNYGKSRLATEKYLAKIANQLKFNLI